MPKANAILNSINKSIADAAPAAAVSEFKEAVKEVMDTLTALGNSPNVSGEWADKARDAVERVTAAQALWEHQIERLIDAQEALKQKSDECIGHQNAALQIENETAHAGKTLEAARVELMEKLGHMTPEQAIRLRVDIDDLAIKDQTEQIKLQGDVHAQNAKSAALESVHNETMETKANAQRAEAQRNLDATTHRPAAREPIHRSRDDEQQANARNETGFQAGADAGILVNKAKTVAANLFGQAPNAAQHAEIHEILNRIIGFQENQSIEVRRQASALAEVKSRVETLDSQFAMNRNGP